MYCGSVEFVVATISLLEIFTYRVPMIDKSSELVKQLNRLVNDRSLAPQARNKVREAMLHIKDLNIKLKEIQRAPIN